MRPLILALALIPAPVFADCAADVAGLFQGGPLDPFTRPNRHEQTVTVMPDGAQVQPMEVWWDGVTRSKTCTEAMCAMQIGHEMFIQPPGLDWMAAPSQLPEDLEGFARQIADDMAANVTEAECLGAQEREGAPVTVYRYRTRTNPNEFDAWFGGLFTAYVGADGQLVRLDEAESVAHYQPEPDPGAGMRVTTYTYDPTISLSAPEG